MRRFYLPLLPEAAATFIADTELSRHMKVLRLKVGDQLYLFDQSGKQATATIEQSLHDRYVLRILEIKCGPMAVEHELVLVQCLPKGSKLDTNVRMATEIGVSKIILAISERTVSRPDSGRAGAKLKRLERIAEEAARQSARRSVPELVGPLPLLDIADELPEEGRRLVFWECCELGLDTLWPASQTVQKASVVIGPEGGLGEMEIEGLEAMGFSQVGLGPTILRVETAVPVILALVAERMGMLKRTGVAQ
ncbi:MAG: 16S rRNA (uracil(1498)-N(3))-methyltransferase [Myxococcales bacterium]|nr:MAG: 16S rRNA (uracil(1498)-N(3))-methyltransferase [Myxococcales bacterium]